MIGLLPLAEVPLAEREHLLPAVHGLLLPVGRAVVVEEPMAGAVVAVELVLLAVLLELRLVLVDLLGRGRLVLVAEEAEDRAGQVLGVVDGGHRLTGRQLLLRHDDPSAPAVDHRVESLEPAPGEEGLPAARARAEHADLAGDVGQRPQEGVGAVEIAEDAGIRGPARRAHLGPDILGRAVAVAEVQVRRDGHHAVMGEAARALAVPLVPARRVVDDNHAGEGARAQRACQIRVDDVAVVPLHGHRLGDHALVLVRLVAIHMRVLPSEMLDTVRPRPSTGNRAMLPRRGPVVKAAVQMIEAPRRGLMAPVALTLPEGPARLRPLAIEGRRAPTCSRLRAFTIST